MRDLCRARADLVADRRRARQRLHSFLLRHARVYRAGGPWTHGHTAWLAAQTFDQPALTATFDHYRGVLAVRDAAVDAVTAELAVWYDRPPFAEAVHRLGAYRGITHLGGLTLAAEVRDWRRFARAAVFMGFVGLVPSEYSTGSATRRGSLTKAGNAHVRVQSGAFLESAWAYQHRPSVGVLLARRQHGAGPDTPARSWAAQLRLHRRFAALLARRKKPSVAAVAIARELAGLSGHHFVVCYSCRQKGLKG